MISKEDISLVEGKTKVIRRNILEMMKPPKGGHLGGSMSCADIISVLYYYKMKYDATNPKWEKRDRLIMSKGHSCSAQYAALLDLGVIPDEEKEGVKELSCNLQGHPDMNKTPGIEISGGSLGQGLSIGFGMCLGARLDKMDYNVYVILGDGELQEGQIWEAAMAAAHYNLSNIIAIIDNNKQMASDYTNNMISLGNISSKWKSFGWEVFSIDGHNIKQIADILDIADDIDKPVCILANTFKGKGIDFAEDKLGYHKAAISQDQYNAIIKKFIN